MKTGVKIQMEKKPKEEPKKTHQPPWPTQPVEDSDLPKYQLDILFFDGSSEQSADSDSGYAPVKMLDDKEDLFCDEVKVTNGWIGHDIHARIIQNNHLRDLDDSARYNFFSDQWLGTGPNGVDGITDREFLKVTREEDIQANDDVFPVGTMTPNIRATLLDNDGNEINQADLLSIYDGSADAIVAESGDYDEILGYRWFNPQSVGHLKVEEKTSKGYYCAADCQMRDIVTGAEYFFIYEPYQNNGSAVMTYEIEGVFWNSFNTADSDNFKITDTPVYDADEYDDPVVKMDQTVKTIRVYLMPRPWWGMLRYSSGRTDSCYGIWTVPPKDFVMPKPRKAGSWQGSHHKEFPDSGGVVCYIIENWSAAFWGEREENLKQSNAISQITLPGDDDEGNGFWIFHKMSNEAPEMFYPTHPHDNGSGGIDYYTLAYPDSPWPFVTEPSTAFGFDQLYTTGRDWFNSWMRYPDGTIRRSVVQTFVNHTSYQLPWLYVHDGWWGSTPDGKIPVMSKSIGFSPGAPYYAASTYQNPNWTTPETTATRTYQFYDPTDEDTYIPEETAKIASIKSHFMSRKFVSKTDPPNAFIFGCGEAREGDLVAVIEQNDDLLYVWRRTDERMAYSGPGIGVDSELDGGYRVNYNDLPVGSLLMDYQVFHHGYYSAGGAGIPCVELYNITGKDGIGGQVTNHFGHIQLERASELEPMADYGLVPRMVKFGSWLEIPHSNRDHVIEHEGTVNLGVRPLYYEQQDQIAFYDKRVQVCYYSA